MKVVPEAQSTPNMATMSPADASLTSCISFECMRTSFGTRTCATPHAAQPRCKQAEEARRGQPELDRTGPPGGGGARARARLELIGHGDDTVASVDGALVQAHVGKLAELALLELEREADEGLAGVATQRHLGLVSRQVERAILHLGRCRQVVDLCARWRVGGSDGRMVGWSDGCLGDGTTGVARRQGLGGRGEEG